MRRLKAKFNSWKAERKVSVKFQKEQKRMSVLGPAERSDPLRMLKLGLDPTGPAITDVYVFNEVLGKGQFGSVQRVTHIKTARHYACKLLKTHQLKTANLMSEIRVLKECKHPNIIFLKEVFATEEYIYLVMELAQGGELFQWIMQEGSLTEKYAALATIQIASALSFMHAKGIVHRDMKPENLLLERRSQRASIKICDFGLSKIFRPDSPGPQARAGSCTLNPVYCMCRQAKLRTSVHGSVDIVRPG